VLARGGSKFGPGRSRPGPKFYVNKVKVIPDDLLNWITPEGLAYWMMDDGSRAGSGFYLHTKSFTVNEVYKLAGILH